MRLSLAGSLGAAALLSAALGMAAPARAQDLAWLGSDTVQVAPHRMGLNGSHSNEPLLGYLVRPDTPGHHPAVVVLHGCVGFKPDYPVIADVLKSYGYMALALDSLDQINACSPGGSGDIAEAFDTYAALGWLAQQNFVDPDRIALLGFSMGGNAALESAIFCKRRSAGRSRPATSSLPGRRRRAIKQSALDHPHITTRPIAPSPPLGAERVG